MHEDTVIQSLSKVKWATLKIESGTAMTDSPKPKNDLPLDINSATSYVCR
jgi:hypothetical protein